MPKKTLTRSEAILFQYDKLDNLRKEGDYICLVQKVPLNLGRIQGTTCWYSQCPEMNSIILPEAFHVSVEVDDQINKTRSIGCLASVDLARACRSSRDLRYSKRGIGARNQIWMCLGCFQALIEEAHQLGRIPRPAIGPNVQWHPIRDWAEWLFGDIRKVPDNPGKFTLQPSLCHCIEKWKAAHRYVDLYSIPDYKIKATDCIIVPENLLLGRDGVKNVCASQSSMH